MTKLKTFLIALATLLIVLGLFVKFYLLAAVSIPANSNFSFDLQAVRNLAREQTGPLPVELNSLLVGQGSIPRFLLYEGGSLEQNPLPTYAYQVVYPDKTLMIDAVNDEATQMENFPDSIYYPANYQLMQDAMRKASKIVLTHEHFDHASGISQSPWLEEIASRTFLTEEQLASPLMEQAKFTKDVKARLQILSYNKHYLLAPGVVLIKAPSHTPGSQMIYILLEDGRELLLVGDIAWHMDNISLPRAHPRLINWALEEDVSATNNLLRMLHDLTNNHPEINIVVAHDGEQMADYVAKGLINEGLK